MTLRTRLRCWGPPKPILHSHPGAKKAPQMTQGDVVTFRDPQELPQKSRAPLHFGGMAIITSERPDGPNLGSLPRSRLRKKKKRREKPGRRDRTCTTRERCWCQLQVLRAQQSKGDMANPTSTPHPPQKKTNKRTRALKVYSTIGGHAGPGVKGVVSGRVRVRSSLSRGRSFLAKGWFNVYIRICCGQRTSWLIHAHWRVWQGVKPWRVRIS
jgi:hypothetical protein